MIESSTYWPSFPAISLALVYLINDFIYSNYTHAGSSDYHTTAPTAAIILKPTWFTPVESLIIKIHSKWRGKRERVNADLEMKQHTVHTHEGEAVYGLHRPNSFLQYPIIVITQRKKKKNIYHFDANITMICLIDSSCERSFYYCCSCRWTAINGQSTLTESKQQQSLWHFWGPRNNNKTKRTKQNTFLIFPGVPSSFRFGEKERGKNLRAER